MGEVAGEPCDVFDLVLHDRGRPGGVAEGGFADQDRDVAARFVEDQGAAHPCGDHAVDLVGAGPVVDGASGQVQDRAGVLGRLQECVHDERLPAEQGCRGLLGGAVGGLVCPARCIEALRKQRAQQAADRLAVFHWSG